MKSFNGAYKIEKVKVSQGIVKHKSWETLLQPNTYHN